MKGMALLAQSDSTATEKIAAYLKKNGYDVTCAGSGEELCSLAASGMPDVIISDLVYPDINGFKVIENIRKWSNIPIVVVSSVGAERDKVRALDLGADDYIVKPFMKKEFLARLRAVMRRKRISVDTEFKNTKKYTCRELEIDFEKRLVTAHGNAVRLTPVEYKIVELLCKYSGCVLTYEYILKQVWGPYVTADNKILRVNMTNIRRKIEKDPKNPVFFHTENGIGYRITRCE